MLICTDLVKKYRGLAAVDHLSLQLETGKIYALLGPNGSGKSTFMKIVAGLIQPTSGEITFDSMPIGPETKTKIAYMPIETYFYSYMTWKDAGRYYEDFFSDFRPDRYRLLAEPLLLSDLGVAFEKGTHTELARALTEVLAEMQADGTVRAAAQAYGLDGEGVQ